MNSTQSVIQAVGEVMRERFKEIEAEIRRTDRGYVLVQTVESLRIKDSLAALRAWVRTTAHHRSRFIEASGPTPWWAEKVDGGTPT